MSSEKLQQAITLIKSGDKQGGQKLLTEIVNSDPRNETAWLWLASVVPQDKRVYCLEKVLDINPNNLQAKQYLEQLKAREFGTQIPVRPEAQPIFFNNNPKESASTVAEQPATSAPQFWTIPLAKNLVTIIFFQDAELIELTAIPMKVPSVLAELNRGPVTKGWFSKNIISGSYKSVPLDRISRVRLLLNDIKINYRNETGKDVSTEISCKEDEISEAMMGSFQKRLGDGFVRVSKPNSRWEVAGRSLIALLITFGVTGFCYWGVLDLGNKEVHGRGSGIAVILQLLGPNGILCIGGGLLILLLIVTISQFVKPPMETLLVRKGSSKS